MPLILTSQDQAGLIAATAAFLTPLDFADANQWRQAANRAVARLIGADCAAFMLPDPNRSAPYIYSEQWSNEITTSYPVKVAPVDKQYQFWRRQIAAGAWSRSQIFNSAMYRSAYYNDYVVPARAFDAVGITIESDVGGSIAGVLYHHTTPRGRRFGKRGLALLHLMKGAFAAGVRTFQVLASLRRSIAGSIDGIDRAVMLVDSTGALVHLNPRAVALFNTPHGVQLRAEIEATTRALMGAPGSIVLATVPTRTIEIGGIRYLVHVSFAGDDLARLHATGIVTVWTSEQPSRRAPQPALLADALRLTLQEARVAALLCERRSNGEIARTLALSPHTARHHTERVLAKLGVHSRRDVLAEVERRLRALNQPTGG
jgi:DNA-binding CsgD family transcriptional regulator